MTEFSNSATHTAPVLWAQRKDFLYLTIPLADVKDHSIELKEKGLTFLGTSGGKKYSLNLEFVSIRSFKHINA
jgi:hypothetical protein